jgi:acyl carrier protein
MQHDDSAALLAVRETVARLLGVSVRRVVPDLGLDQTRLFMTALQLEGRLQIEIPLTRLENIRTVEELGLLVGDLSVREHERHVTSR